jgi:hypothetical protein
MLKPFLLSGDRLLFFQADLFVLLLACCGQEALEKAEGGGQVGGRNPISQGVGLLFVGGGPLDPGSKAAGNEWLVVTKLLVP